MSTLLQMCRTVLVLRFYHLSNCMPSYFHYLAGGSRYRTGFCHGAAMLESHNRRWPDREERVSPEASLGLFTN